MNFSIMRYANKYITKLIIASILLTACYFIIGCRQEDPSYPVPSIQFVTGPSVGSPDTTLLLNDTIRIGLTASTNSDVKLTHLHTTVIRDSAIAGIDTALYTQKLDYERLIVKGIARNETWIFYVRDRDGRKSREISITLKLDPASIFGNIRYIPSLTFGAQENPRAGSFCSLTSGLVYSLEEAFENQELISLLYYYDLLETDENIIASPGANIDPSFFAGPTGLQAWTTKNTTRFIYQGNITPEEFDLSQNDSLILSNTFEFENGKRKAKNLAPGQVYSFATDGGLKGLFKVKDMVDKETGTIEISIKMKN